MENKIRALTTNRRWPRIFKHATGRLGHLWYISQIVTATFIALRMQRDNNFDILRFLAASLVLFSHCYPLTGHEAAEPIAALTGIDSGGGLAVAIFFVISGYLITGSCKNSNGVADYAIKRVLRLFPGLAVCVALTVLVLGAFLTTLHMWAYLHHPLTRAYLSNIWLFIRYTLPGVFESNAYPGAVNGSLWTLPVEVLMYVIVLALGIVRALNTRVMVIFVGACWLFYFRGIPAFGLQSAVWHNNFPVAESAKLACLFFGGALLYLHGLSKLNRVDLVMLAVFAIVAVRGTDAQHAAYIMLAPLIVITLAFASLGRVAQFGKHGDISYGIYIYAFPVQQTMVHFLGNDISPLALFCASLPVTCLLSALSWRFVEKPALGLKKHRAVLALERRLSHLIPVATLPANKPARN
ncbi:acyltransferase [Paraburkholderia sediminicola]|uniref:acyltransferase family protein n=1 Tax=Paraburkholderia sediminicola TaxID=458836 RepID=UPI0038BA7AD1